MARKKLTKEQIERNERLAKAQSDFREIVKRGVCPQCGTPLRRNSSMTGWWQCGAFGVDYMRPVEFAKLPQCSFQGFTE